MKKELIQKRGTSTRHFILHSDKLEIRLKTIRRIVQYDVRLDQLGFDKNFQADNVIVGQIVTVLCVLLPLGLLIGYLLGMDIEKSAVVLNGIIWPFIALLSLLREHQDDIFITGGEKNVNFYRKYPSEQQTLEFIDTAIERAKKYQVDKYLDPKLNLAPDDYLGRLMWLRDRNTISEHQFIELKNDFETRKLL